MTFHEIADDQLLDFRGPVAVSCWRVLHADRVVVVVGYDRHLVSTILEDVGDDNL